MDASGSAPFAPPTLAASVKEMLFDPVTNALFIAANDDTVWGCGPATGHMSLTRIELSTDGSRVTGASSCISIITDPFGSVAVGLRRGPAGDLILVADSNSNDTAPRMQRVDPVTLVATPWASNGGPGSGATNAGLWSSTLGRVVILNTGNDVLLVFDEGETGSGTILPTSLPVSGAGGSGEYARMFEVAPGECGATTVTYCQGKVTSNGCLPYISTTGSPSASAASGFTITGNAMASNQSSIFFYSLNGAASIPLLGGTFCVQPNFIRTPVTTTSGTSNCDGQTSIDFNAYMATGINPSLGPGTIVHGQFWFRDPAHPVGGVGFTNGVTFTVCP
jgi:hypothetical protein